MPPGRPRSSSPLRRLLLADMMPRYACHGQVSCAMPHCHGGPWRRRRGTTFHRHHAARSQPCLSVRATAGPLPHSATGAAHIAMNGLPRWPADPRHRPLEHRSLLHGVGHFSLAEVGHFSLALQPEHAATLRLLLDAFPGARIAAFEKAALARDAEAQA
jgi:hypothetical protein